VWEELQRQGDAEGDVEWSLHHVDGTVIRAHQHAAGARKRGGEHAAAAVPVPAASAPEDEHPDEAVGRSQGGCSTKVHLRVDRQGTIMTFVVTAGQRHEQTAFSRLMERGAIKRPGRGRPRVRPQRVAADKG